MARRTRRKVLAPGDFEEGSEAQQVFDSIEKKYGGVARKGSTILQPTRVSTGSFMFDFCTLGGLPVGRQNMVLGEKHAGKTTIACKVIAQCQRQNPDQIAVMMDCEKAFDTVWAAKLGVDLDRLQVVESEVGEAAVDMANLLIGTDLVSMIAIDSIAALLPTVEAEASAEDKHMGLQSRLVGELCRKMGGTMMHERMRGHEPMILYLNQYRTKIGQMFGDPRTAPGGRALEHFPSIVWRMLNKEIEGRDEYDSELILHNEHSFAITKNKLCNGPRHGEFRLCRYDDPDMGLTEGDIDDSKTVLTYAKKFGVFTGGGKTWRLEFNDSKFRWDSPTKGAEYLNKNRPVYKAIYNYVIQRQAIAMNMPAEFVGRFDTVVHG